MSTMGRTGRSGVGPTNEWNMERWQNYTYPMDEISTITWGETMNATFEELLQQFNLLGKQKKKKQYLTDPEDSD